MSEKGKETRALAKTVEQELTAMTRKEVDEAVRTSSPFRSEDFVPVFGRIRTITLSGKVSPFIAHMVRELASQDMVTVSQEVDYLVTAGIWERLQRAGAPNATTRLDFLMMKMAARANKAEKLKQVWGALNELPPDEAAEAEKLCMEAANEWNLRWPPPDRSGSPLDKVVWDAFESLAREKKARGEDGGRVRLREIYRRANTDSERAELAMARHPTARREEGSRGTIWYWIPASDDGESSEQLPHGEATDSRDEEDVGVANLPE